MNFLFLASCFMPSAKLIRSIRSSSAGGVGGFSRAKRMNQRIMGMDRKPKTFKAPGISRPKVDMSHGTPNCAMTTPR